MKKHYKSSSEILMEIAQDKSLKGDITYRDILQAVGERAFGIALLIFSLPSALPFSFIPGISLIFSVPIVIFAFQMIIARKSLWLPKIIADQTISHEKIAKIIHAAMPYLKKIERLLKPRWGFMTSRFMGVVNGVTILCIALLLMLPIPLSNFLLAALLIMFGLGLVEKDGVLIALGYVGFIIYLGFIYLVILTAVKAFVM